ncbi:hypothetical protein ABZ702_35985 [Streptomyces cyaneofuscatus]|uniref:hypothetical protein n=1 Tax=Streptomyces cyaneofuscatus TaxID=66883 RepID=UPI0034035F2A
MALLKLLCVNGEDIEGDLLCDRQQVAIRLEKVQQSSIVGDDRIYYMPNPLIGTSIVEYVVQWTVQLKDCLVGAQKGFYSSSRLSP